MNTRYILEYIKQFIRYRVNESVSQILRTVKYSKNFIISIHRITRRIKEPRLKTNEKLKYLFYHRINRNNFILILSDTENVSFFIILR